MEDADFPPPGFEHKAPGGAANGRAAGGRPNSRTSTGSGGGRVVTAVRQSGGVAVPVGQPPKSPGRRRRGKQLNVEAQNFQPGRGGAQQAPKVVAVAQSAPAAPAYSAVTAGSASSAPAPASAAPEPAPQQHAAPAAPQPAPAVAAAQMSAQQSAAALQQIAMGGGFAPTIMQQPPMQQAPMQQAPMQQQPQMQQQPVQYVMQQPVQYAPAPGMQPGYTYVAVPYPPPAGEFGGSCVARRGSCEQGPALSRSGKCTSVGLNHLWRSPHLTASLLPSALPRPSALQACRACLPCPPTSPPTPQWRAAPCPPCRCRRSPSSAR